MGSIIHKVATAEYNLPLGYMYAGAKAVRSCLKDGGIDSNQAGMLINTGVYNDNHIQEPAIAALIQGKMNKGLEPGLENLFSFDLHDGGGGMIMAIRILNGFLESGKIEHGIIVAGDAIPENARSKGRKYSELAGAILLGKGEPATGFIRFAQDVYPEYMNDFRSYTNYIDNELKTIINQSDIYQKHCVECAQKSVFRFLLEEKVQVSEIDLIVSSQSPVGFAEKIDKVFKEGKVIVLEGGHEMYSGGLAFAVERAMEEHKFSSAKKTLFLTVGAGITVNLALYQR